MPVPILDQHWSQNGEPRPPTPHHFSSNTVPPQTPAPPPPPSMPDLHDTGSIRPLSTPGPTNPQQAANSPPVYGPPLPFRIPDILLNPPFRLSGDPTKHGSWPPRWQKFLEIARSFALNDLLFSHGFPTPFVLRNQAGESLTNAWDKFEYDPDNQPPICRSVCKFYSFVL